MSSNDDDTSKTTITSLPTELITRIVRLSSPKPSWDNAAERLKVLRGLALVCQAFRGPAQEELFRHVVLRSAAASRAFVAVLKSRAGARFAIPFITKRCMKLDSMWLLNIDRLDIAVVTSGTGAALVAFANSVAAQLSSLCIVFGWRGHGLVGLDPKLLSNLCILDTRLPEPDIPHFLPFLPSNIRHLRAQASPLSWHAPIKRSAPEVMDIYLEGSKYPCLKNLEHLRCGVDDSDPEVSPEMAKELADKLEGLRPEVRLSFDGRDSPRGPESLDARFNPTFWTFVDDAEAEEARRAPEAREGI
ncbi:hypothetical protein RQP46_005229 [Phenoliferia psychrophenolica]